MHNQNKSSKVTLIIFLSIIIYISTLILDLIFLKKYLNKVSNLINPFDKTNFLHEKLNLQLKSFCTNEFQLVSRFLNEVLIELSLSTYFFILNLILYFSKSRKYFEDVFNYFLKKNDFYKNVGSDLDISMLRLVAICSLCVIFSIRICTLKGAYNILLTLLIGLILFMFKKFVIPYKGYKFSRIAVLSINSAFFISYFILSITKNQFDLKNFQNEIPDFLKNQAKNLAVDFYNDKIFYAESKFLGICSKLTFQKICLCISGPWNKFTKKELQSIIAHEIGHGTKSENFLCKSILISVLIFVSIIFYEMCYKISVSQRNLKQPIARLYCFMVIINLYFAITSCNLVRGIFIQVSEFLADKRSVCLVKDGRLIDALLKIVKLNDLPMYEPCFWGLLRGRHPSFARRIEAIAKMK